MGVFGADISLTDRDKKPYLETLATLNEQPPFQVDINRPSGIANLFITGEFDWDELLENPTRLKQMTNLDHLIVVNQDDLKQMQDENGNFLCRYSEESIKAWLEINHPSLTKMINEEGLYEQHACLETHLALTFSRGDFSFSPAYAIPFSANASYNMQDKPQISMGVIVMQDEQLWSQALEMKDLNIVLTEPVSLKIQEEVKKIVVVHELEHAMGQNEMYTYFEALQQNGILNISDKEVAMMATHCGEIEADLGVYQKFEGLISDDTLDYFGALRTVRNFYQQMNYPETCENGLAVHDTGFFIREFRDTGELPNYFHTCNTLEGFYDKTRNFYEEQYSKEVGQRYSRVGSASLNVMADIVRKAMNADPPIYTPEEQQIAFNYIDSMNVLGAEIHSSNDYFQEMKAKYLGNNMNMSPSLQQNTFAPSPQN